MVDVWILAALAAYFLGSIPFGIFAAKIVHGPDPRTVGSKNIGFTNVLRTSGKKAGILTLAGDLGKGFVVATLVNAFGIQEPQAFLVIFGVVAGHLFPVFLKFHGGKGVATGLGALMGYDFLLGFLVVTIWGLTVLIWRYSSGGAIAAFVSLPLVSMVMGRSHEFLLFSLVLSGFILWKHRSNIQRLLRGTENKIGTGHVSS